MPTKVHIVKAIVFPVVVYRCESWTIKKAESWNWCLQTIVLEKTLESHLDSKKIKPVNPKGNQPWIFIGRTDAEAEAPILWPPDVMSQLIGKDPDAGKDWGQEEKGMTEDEMVGRHHWHNGQGFGWTPGVYPNSCPLSQWCHPTISSSLVPFSSCPQSFLASGSFPVSRLFIT